MPNKDKNIPKRRFKAFENADAWELRKFKDILKTHSFRSYLAGVSENGEYEIIQQGDKPIVGYSDGEPFTDYKDVTLFGDHTVSLYKPKSPFFVATDGVKILSADNFEGNYLYTTLERYKPEPQGYKRHFTILKNQDVCFTENMEEQQKIGSFFKQLDDTIALHQHKLDLLKEQKKGFLQKMFPKNGAKVPELRFAGFADDWELRKVGELLTERNEQAPMNDEFPLMAFIANEGVAPKGERYDRSSLVNDTAGKLYKKTRFGDFIYSSNNLETGSIGLNKYGNASVSPVYSIFEATGIADSDFIGRRLVRKDFINAMIKWRQGVVYGQWKIHESDFVKIEVAVPSVDEQRQIGEFLDTLDQQITLHQRKLDKLKSVKQAYLSEMFPAEGERVPKRRFPGFTDDWELRKLGEVVYRSNLISSSKDLPRLEFEDINSGLGTLNKDISQKLDYRKGLEFNVGDVLFGKLRPYLKNWWYAEFKGIALGDFWNLKSDLWHSCFLYTYIQSNSFQLVANDTSGTKMPRSDWNLVAESIAKFPSLPEQKAIGTFFSTLDQHITLHQRKLEKLKNLKKALLNELFV